jgi:predicted nucleotidyltransferase
MSNELIGGKYDEIAGSTVFLIHEPYLSQIKAILERVFGPRAGSNYEVYLFGSRATGRYEEVSDFDIGVLASDDISRQLSIARELLEVSNIPFTVDLVDLSVTSKEFANQVRREGILLWKS